MPVDNLVIKQTLGKKPTNSIGGTPKIILLIINVITDNNKWFRAKWNSTKLLTLC